MFGHVLAAATSMLLGVATPADDAALAYMTALGTTDPGPALAVAAPDSPAYYYAVHQTAINEALLAYGESPVPKEVTVRGDGIEQCQPAADGSTSCFLFRFVTDDAGLITSLSVDGESIDGHIGGRSDEVVTGPITASVRSSYRTVTSDFLFVVIDLESTVDIDIAAGAGANYITADGAEMAVGQSVGAKVLVAGARSVVVLTFPGVDAGGRIVWDLTTTECCDDFQLDLPVPVLVAQDDEKRDAATTAATARSATRGDGGQGSPSRLRSP